MIMKTLKTPLLTAFAALTLLSGSAALAQAPVTSATVHGKVINYGGQPYTSGDVKFTKEKTTPTADLKFAPNMVFPIDAQGHYTATGLPAGDYYVFFTQGAVIADRLELTIKPTDTDITLDDDETRPDYIATLTPEQKKTLEEYKKNNAAAASANVVIANLNETLKTVIADLAAAAPTKGDVSADVAKMKSAVTSKPDEPVLWNNYGNTLLAQGDHLAAVDKAASKPAITDPDVKQMYSDAVDAFKKGIDLSAASKKPNPSDEAASYNQMGTALKDQGKYDEAEAAFDKAAKTMPAKAGTYYTNAAISLYNSGQMDQAAAEADKAITAAPNDPIAYFIKGQALVTKVSVDSKTGKLTAPPGCVDAYNKFLELTPPTDPKVAQVKEVLTNLGEKVTTKYKAGKP
jgi:tetratricopeptide (TPR) repeat protein